VAPALCGVATAFDEGRLVERIMLAAAARGLGSCIAGFSGVAQVAAAKAMLGVPADRTLNLAVAIGRPAGGGARLLSRERGRDTGQPLAMIPLGRKPLTELVHLEAYGRRLPATAGGSSSSQRPTASVSRRPSIRSGWML
jgi:nitroreductase